MPIPTYFFYGTHMPDDVQSKLEAKCPERAGLVQLVPNLTYMGSAGLAVVHGFRIAFCGGVSLAAPPMGSESHDATRAPEIDWHASLPVRADAVEKTSTWTPLDTPAAVTKAVHHMLSHPAMALGEARAPPPPSDPESLQQARSFQYAQAAYEFQLERDAEVLQARPPVDFLLTTSWPLGIDVLAQAPPSNAAVWGQPAIARLAEAARPRYHVVHAPIHSAEPGVFWEREPYENPPFAALPPPSVPPITRFVSLATAANASKVRWFLALQLAPADEVTTAARPSPLTPSPLWMVASEPPSHKKGSAKRVHTGEIERSGARPRRQRRTEAPVGPDQCWFCLSNPAVEKHLIVAVGMECYVALPKGQLPVSSDEHTLVPGGGHVLIVPIMHTPSLYASASSEAVRHEVAAWKAALTSCYASMDAVPVTWEVVRRGTRAGHTQTQVVPIARELAEACEAYIRKAGEDAGYAWEAPSVTDVWPHEDAPVSPQDREDYCCIEIDGRRLLLLLHGTRFNIQFPRYVHY